MTDQQLLRDLFPVPTYEQWRSLAEEQLEGAPFDKKLITRTPEGINLQPIYRSADLEGLTHHRTFPGTDGYVRGTTASGKTACSWAIAQEIPESTPAEFNKALLDGLNRGQSAVNLTLDVATAHGRDADQGETGEVGACGVSLSVLGDFDQALEGVFLDKIPLYVQSGISALPIAAFIQALLHKRQLRAETILGALDFDPYGALIREGQLPMDLDAVGREMRVLVNALAHRAPKLKALTASGLPYADGGAHAVQELAYALGTAVDYLRILTRGGVDGETAAGSIRFNLSAGRNFFIELAKFRASRLLWSRVIRESGGSDAAARIELHVRTGLWNKTALDPYVNLLRTTTEALSAVLGGCDSLHSGPFDEVFRVPDGFSRRIARNTQIMLAEECDLQPVIDPAGGSYAIEKLTHELAEAAWKEFQEVERLGGMGQAILQGYPQSRIAEVQAERLKLLAQRRDAQVGVNLYANPTEKPLPARIPDYAAIKENRAREISEYRVSADSASDAVIMLDLQGIADSAESLLFDHMVEAASHGATIGEITRSLRANYSGKLEAKPIFLSRGSVPYERLRTMTDDYRATTGLTLPIYLATIGPLSSHKVRADWIRDFFTPGGFDLVYPQGADSPEAVAQGILSSGARIAVICGVDPDYPAYVPAICRQVKAARPEVFLLLAGHPGDHEQPFRDAGMDDFVYVRTNNLEFLQACATRLGVKL